jgi:FixJ family two-component response regulator
MLEVADSGMGMDTDTLTHIFEPFFTTKGVGKGTGLGLATVYGVVKQSEGYIWVDSEPGKGASFQVFLPKVSEEKTDELPAATQQRTATISSETILLVEDSDPLRKLTQSFLESSGFRVLVAADGEDALRVASLHPEKIHLLVTDVVMPGINGRVLAERLLAKQHGMKVLFISGYTDSFNAVHGVRERGMALLNKPYTEEELIEGVRKVLNGSSDEIAENRIWNLSERQTQGNR